MNEENESLTREIEDETERLKKEEEYQVRNEIWEKNNAIRILGRFRYQNMVGQYRGKCISTGFKNLDAVLDGGLFSGLYVLGAISSLGKTSLMLQIADQISASGQDVLYISLEMSSLELVAKSLSRLTYQNCKGNTSNAKTVRGILAADRYKSYSKAETDLINKADEEYGLQSANIYFHEGIGDIGVVQITDILEKHIKYFKHKPCLMLDYLQILSPYDMRASDKQNVDKAILELKRISRDYDIPILVISAFNRNSYNSEVDMSAFRESSGIEYGSDVLMALQPKGITPGYTKRDIQENARIVKECKRSTTRQIELVILKNRNGRTGLKVDFEYKALFNYFKEKGLGEEDLDQADFEPKYEPLEIEDDDNPFL